VTSWDEIWNARVLDRTHDDTLAALLAADGFDTGFGNMTTESWVEFIRSVERLLGLEAPASVYEVGCGAGAFLFDLASRGYRVAGSDRSTTLIGYAREALPDGRFAVADAAELPVEEPSDVVVSCGVFLYFPSLDYASTVIRLMTRKATSAIALLDLPDLALREKAEAHRRAAMGSNEAYEARYAGLEHLAYDRNWVVRTLQSAGLTGVQVADQWIEGYENAEFRFNAWGFRRS